MQALSPAAPTAAGAGNCGQKIPSPARKPLLFWTVPPSCRQNAGQLTEEVFADGGEIPQWAAQAVILNATNAGILDTQNGQVRPNDTLTRAEAVQMVYRAFPQEEESGGILDFLKTGSWSGKEVAFQRLLCRISFF